MTDSRFKGLLLRSRIPLVNGPLQVQAKTKRVTIPNIEYFKCEKCGETLTDTENEKRIAAFLLKEQDAA